MQDRKRCHFQQGDACNLPLDLGQFGCVVGANLVCRLPDPMDFLNRVPGLVASGGVLVLTTPASWDPAFTPKVTFVLCNKSFFFFFYTLFSKDQPYFILDQWTGLILVGPMAP